MNPAYKNKYEAAKDFDDGLRKALFCENQPGFTWEDASKIFMDGYSLGRELRETVQAKKNHSLVENGIEPIGVMVLRAKLPE